MDGSTIAADANPERKAPPETMQKTWAVKDEIARPVRDYLDQLAADAGEVPEGPRNKAPKYLLETDPQAAWSIKDEPGRFSYETNYLYRSFLSKSASPTPHQGLRRDKTP